MQPDMPAGETPPLTFPPLKLNGVKTESDDATERCATCRFFDRDKAQVLPNAGSCAPCRRFPPTTALRTVTNFAPGMRAPQVAQQPSTLPTFVQATEWCGEWQLETRAAAYAKRTE